MTILETMTEPSRDIFIFMKENTQSPTSCISLLKHYSFTALDQVYSSLLLCTNRKHTGKSMKMHVHLPLATSKLDLSTELELQLSIC